MAHRELDLLSLPIEVFERILTYFSYDELSHLRLVCKLFDSVCQQLLNKGFAKVDRYHAAILRRVKSQLPRRESERRNHPLARHCDILTAIETRLSLLSMTFMKYVDMNLCSFIPGKVIDEIYKVLHCIEKTPSPPRAHEILQELRDISSMAMEHFDEKIVPDLKQKMASGQMKLTITPRGHVGVPGTTSLMSSVTSRYIPRLPVIRQDHAKLQQQIKNLSSSIISCKKEVIDCKTMILEQKKKLLEQDKKIMEQNRLLNDQNSKISSLERKLNETNRKLLEYDQKFADIMAELSRCREECAANRSGTEVLYTSRPLAATPMPSTMDSSILPLKTSGVKVETSQSIAYPLPELYHGLKRPYSPQDMDNFQDTQPSKKYHSS